MTAQTLLRRVQSRQRLLVTVVVLLAAVAQATEPVEISGRLYEFRGDTLFVVQNSQAWEVVPGIVMLRVEDDLSDAEADSVLGAVGLPILRRGPARGCYDLKAPLDADPLELLRGCSNRSGVADVWPNTRAHWAATPSDSFFARRIGGDPPYNEAPWWHQWNLRQIDAAGAWDIETGDPDVVVGVIDSGIELRHEDLKGSLWVNWAEFYGTANEDDDLNGCVDDTFGCYMADSTGNVNDAGHGTQVAGMIAAQTNSDTIGIAGLAGGWYGESENPGCRMMTARGYDSVEFRLGLDYVRKMGAAVANMSFNVMPDAQWRAAIDTAAASAMIMVAASGNGGAGSGVVGFPATDADVIAVGGVDVRGYDLFYSQGGDSLDVVAPSSVCVAVDFSCDFRCESNYPDSMKYPPGTAHGCMYDSLFVWTTFEGAYDFFGGTSAAAPQVSALAGLLKSFDPSLDRDEVKDLICRSAEDQIGDEDDTPGWDERYGWGRINAYQALYLARGGGATTSNLRLCYDVTFDRDVEVSDGDTLTLLPGVTVTFAGGSDADNLGVDEDLCELIVEGTLIAVGEDGNGVTFTSDGDTAGSWYGIRVAGKNAEAHVRRAVVEHAYKGVSADEPAVLDVSQSVVQDCVTHGIYLDGCGSSAVVDTNLVVSPGLIGVEVRACEDLVVLGNRIEDATAYGIKCTESYGVTVEADTILGAEDESGFVGIYYKPAGDDSTYAIVGNEVRRAGSCGISVEYGSPETALIEGNVVTDDGYDTGTVGAYFYASGAAMRGTTVEEKSYGVVALVEKVTPVRVPDLGRDETGEEGENRFVENGQYHIYTDIVSPDTLKAELNWYGSSSPSAGKFSAQVDWHPYLEEDPGMEGRRVVPSSGGELIPAAVELASCRPNPFGPGARLAYGVPARCHVSLRVYSASGREVAVLVDGEREAGRYEVAWEGRSSLGARLPSGVYFVRLEACGEQRLGKVVFLK